MLETQSVIVPVARKQCAALPRIVLNLRCGGSKGWSGALSQGLSDLIFESETLLAQLSLMLL